MTNNILGSSFRDPDGFVFSKDGKIFRQINPSYKENYEFLVSSKLLQTLTDKALLVSHQEVGAGENGAYKIIEPQKIPHISYPYEWSFSQLKDAALLTLRIQRLALKHGMSLKDASAYNIQFYKGKPIFIDTLSFEKYKEGSPWVAYKQFCQHFLAPLLLMKHTNISLNQLLKVYLDGVPLDLANSMLPLKSKFCLGIFLHIFLHSKAQKKFESKDVSFAKVSKIAKEKLFDIIENLESLIQKTNFPKTGTEWGEYYTFTNYSDAAFDKKKQIIDKFLDKVNPQSLWDLGANNGLFSRIASNRGINTVAFDIDPIAIEKNYLHIKQSGETNILPILSDLTNPAPAIGWANAERMSFAERSPVDVIMALALIHHICISNNVPFSKVASYFSKMAKYVIIEFVPKSDSQVVKLLASREDVFVNYNQKSFEADFGVYFEIMEAVHIEGSERTLYLMKTK